MRNVLLLSLLLAMPATIGAQAPAAPPATAPKPAQPAAPPTTAKPTPPPAARPAQRRAQPQTSTRSGMAITVTTPQGSTIEGIQVELMGATARNGVTNSSGQVNFPGLQAGSYRLRFSSDAVTTLERDLTLRAGEIADVDVTLSPAPPPKEVPAAAPPPPAPATTAAAAPAPGPAGQPLTLSVPDVLEKEYIGKQPRRDSLLACSGTMRTTMIQVNEPLPERLYDTADAAYYVIGGEGTVRMNGKESKLATNGFASVPRGTAHSFQRRGNRPLILLAVLGGAPCEEPR
jgi:hypothetical protein